MHAAHRSILGIDHPLSPTLTLTRTHTHTHSLSTLTHTLTLTLTHSHSHPHSLHPLSPTLTLTLTHWGEGAPPNKVCTWYSYFLAGLPWNHSYIVRCFGDWRMEQPTAVMVGSRWRDEHILGICRTEVTCGLPLASLSKKQRNQDRCK